MTAAIDVVEWERLELMCHCARELRAGGEIDSKSRALLDEQTAEVRKLREVPPWSDVAVRAPLTSLDQELLARALAPDAEPRIGWIFQELQPALASVYPTLALMRELDLDKQVDVRALHERVAPGSPLMSAGLLQPMTSHQNSFEPVKATAAARTQLLAYREAADLSTSSGRRRITFDDVVLPASTRRAITEFIWWTRHRNVAVNEWKLPIVGGATALFHGVSGTGKTMAVEAVASELSLPVYTADLSQLFDKYVGETERRISAMFRDANGALICVNEADALLGRRGEVHDARDRYANLQVAHLLIELERYNGPCVLTTNLRKHLDPAFTRRFQSVIEFHRPDAVCRHLIWKRHLPDAKRLAVGVDLELIAAATELTGGQIRNAAFHAAFLAIGDGLEGGAARDAPETDGSRDPRPRPITMTHIASAIWTELGKSARERTVSSLGPLVKYLPERKPV